MSELEKYLKEIDEDIKNYEIPFFPKFGITFYHGERRRLVSVKELVGQAVYAKSTIKNNHLVQFAVYEPRFLNLINNERIMEANMERALNEEEFIVLYQPKVSLADDRVVGAEALVRWNSKELGFVTPNNFIPLFEKNGFIKKLDFYVYEKVFKFIKKQLDEGKPVVPVSVNMSRNHNKPDKFMHDFMKIFNKYSIPPEYIQVEIVERSFMDMQTLCDITELLHKNGFSVAMDDFGSGESSLSMLTKIPVDVLKFDSQFLISFQKEYIDKNDKAATVLELLINLSKKLEKQTVFEGVETEAQRDFLRLISCDQVQGYFYSKPLFEEDFVNFLARNS
ncbi:MAG: EAL domain-containing protein [Treponema sp.]|nr:EAL domain-containing protein [Treponema sp.]